MFQKSYDNGWACQLLISREVVSRNEHLPRNNKQVILGSQEGYLQLWNISTKKKLYEFKGWNSAITSCVSSPALDVVAVGCADGKIHIHNIRYDEELVTFTHSTRGAVTALSFSTGESLRHLIFH